MSRQVVVTGGGTGLGRAMAQRFAEDGDDVLIVGRRKDVLEATADEINDKVGATLVSSVPADLTSPDDVRRVAAEATADGTVDVVIGTHRLLSDKVRFKDLGLVVVDEEQRFGVEHKEFLKQMRAAVDVPILANMTEFGKSDLFTVQQLQDVGVNMVIFPVSLQRIAMGAIERALDTLAAEGSLASVVPEMQTRARLYEVVDYAAYGDFDSNVYTFDLSTNRS